MGYLYRPTLRSGKAGPSSGSSYCANGRPMRESTRTAGHRWDERAGPQLDVVAFTVSGQLSAMLASTCTRRKARSASSASAVSCVNAGSPIPRDSLRCRAGRRPLSRALARARTRRRE